MPASRYWVTPDAGSRTGRDGSKRFVWDHAVRRELDERPGWLGKAVNPIAHAGRELASGGRRWDLVVEPTKGIKVKLARMLINWSDDDGNVMTAIARKGLEVDHLEEGPLRQPPRNYCLADLRLIDVPSHRKEQPGRGYKRPAAAPQALLRRPART